MLFNRKTALFVSSAILISAFGACSSGVTPAPVSVGGDVNFASSNLVTRISENVTQSKQDPSHFYIDAGNGQKTGASFSVKLNFANGGGFRTKASADGTATAMFGDMTHLRVALVASATSPTDLTGAVTVGAATSNLLAKTVASSGGTATVTFTNVPGAVTTGTKYWVAAAAYASGTNITNVTGATLTDGTYGKFFVTNGGGNAASGAVTVLQTVTNAGLTFAYTVNSTTALTMALNLRDATGATVDSTVTVTNGADRLTTIGAS